jgi:oxygen-independent coproporphyrinogen-3 oxidase
MPGLYVHVPFCARKCAYCDFYSVPVAAAASVDADARTGRFVDTCLREIALRAESLRAGGPCVPFTSVYFGGGTPSLLPAAQLERLLGALRAAFPLAGDAEISMECNPGTVDRVSLTAFRRAGVNRLSIGVQSFDDGDLRMLGRVHTAHEARDAVEDARLAGFDNISIDLMFSLPGQDAARWLRSLETARALGVPHLSCYALTVEEGTPLAGSVARGELRMPDEETDAALFELTMDTLAAWGFEHYEVSNYALPGFACLHNLSYWRGEQYLGFGPAAFSSWDGRRRWNLRDLDAYEQVVGSGTLPEEDGEDLRGELPRSEYLYLALRSEGVDLAALRLRFGAALPMQPDGAVARYIDRGLLSLRGDMLRLTRAGFLLCDEICATLMGAVRDA